jgi:hypothetical protein
MFNVADYLKKFAKLGQGSALLKEAVTQCFVDVGLSGVEFDIRRGIIYIKGNSAIKSMVFMRKGELLAAIATKAPKGGVSASRAVHGDYPQPRCRYRRNLVL